MDYTTYYEIMILDCLNEISYNIILGMPWLREHNPNINWIKGIIERFCCLKKGTLIKNNIKSIGEMIFRKQMDTCLKIKSAILFPQYEEFRSLVRNVKGALALPKH